MERSAPPLPTSTFWARAVVAVLVRPWLWPTALRLLVRLAPLRWWSRPPFLPIPDAGYVRFRMETAYGPGAVARSTDVVAYLRWCRMRET